MVKEKLVFAAHPRSNYGAMETQEEAIDQFLRGDRGLRV